MHSRELDARIPKRVNSAIMSETLVIPLKDYNLVHSLWLTLKRDMMTLSQILIVHKVTLESMFFNRVILISNYHELWEAYIRDIGK
jgi:hypothetical protein